MKTILLFLSTSACLLAQGPLTPPGPPAPSMKSLQELWDKMETLEAAGQASFMKLDLLQQQNGVLQGNVATLQQQNERLSRRLQSLGETTGTLGSSWQILTVDSNLYPNDLSISSLAFTPGGQPAMMYTHMNNVTSMVLEYAVFNGSGWTKTQLDGPTPRSVGVKLAFTPTGHPAILYDSSSTPNRNRIYATNDGSNWNYSIVFSDTFSFGTPKTLSFTAGGLPATTVHEPGSSPSHRLLYMVGGDPSWTTMAVTEGHSVDSDSTLAFAPDGQPSIIFGILQGFGGSNLKYATLSGGVWNISDIALAERTVEYSSLAFTPDGQPAVCFLSESSVLTYAVLNGTTWTMSPIDRGFVHGLSLAINPSGRPAVSYIKGNELKCAVLDGTNWSLTTVDSSEFGVDRATLAFQPTGDPALGYTLRTTVEGRYQVRYAIPTNP